jgi:hypothetical protein
MTVTKVMLESFLLCQETKNSHVLVPFLSGPCEWYFYVRYQAGA